MLDLSVVLASAGRFRNLRRTMSHLRAQTAAAQIELLIVVANEQAIADREPAETEGFGRVEFVYTGQPITNVDRASALGAHAASAPVLALIEDHVYPEPDWAAQLIDIHRRHPELSVIGPTMLNANPHSMLSWTNILIAYGPSTEPNYSGETTALPGHNLSFKTPVLQQYGDRLADRLVRDGGLLDDLMDRGFRIYLHSPARLSHANPSRFGPTIELRFYAGRLYGHSRASENDWTPLHRILYVCGGLLIPLVRFRGFRREFFRAGKRAEIYPRIVPALLFGLLCDALGQMAGYALGPGRAAAILATFEMDRMQHLNSRDRRLLMPS